MKTFFVISLVALALQASAAQSNDAQPIPAPTEANDEAVNEGASAVVTKAGRSIFPVRGTDFTGVWIVEGESVTHCYRRDGEGIICGKKQLPKDSRGAMLRGRSYINED